ncbi:hypothetical protein OHD62_25050 [Mesorhizobium sp. YC-39]|uniref:hypothetical protein n=1 Tax=unclassified Mesorhizobium TaxID=325217 RepID=UPI0021E96A42|nr:hypothetical protein [Mesorhizobium sp. YC-2]MCV3231657.1 hypothetical protein [Mesorhizobium sp. YC-39]
MNWAGYSETQSKETSHENQRPQGTITEIVKGATTSHVRIDIGGAVVTASITNA